MPSTLVHLALGALVAAGLLREEYDARSLGVVLAATALPDLDTFIGIALPGTHRALLHTILVPLAAAGILLYLTRRRGTPLKPEVVRVTWVAIAAYALAGIGPDLFANGVNVLFPVYDQFVSLSGHVWLSDQRGLIQTVWQGAESAHGTTRTVHYSTGVDVRRGSDPANVERIFPLANSGLQFLLVLTAIVVSGARLRTGRATS